MRKSLWISITVALFLSLVFFAESEEEKGIETGLAGPPVDVERKKISVDFELVKTDKCCVAVVRIANISEEEISLIHPGNRFALAFVVMNKQGNVIAPRGLAKVNEAKRMNVVLKPNETCEYKVPGMYVDKYLFRFLSDTALFGYELKFGESYRVIAVYRPQGKEGEGICSAEKIIKYEEHQHE